MPTLQYSNLTKGPQNLLDHDDDSSTLTTQNEQL
jgi:hypothetical protein